jgi:hypothetical protein
VRLEVEGEQVEEEQEQEEQEQVEEARFARLVLIGIRAWRRAAEHEGRGAIPALTFLKGATGKAGSCTSLP